MSTFKKLTLAIIGTFIFVNCSNENHLLIEKGKVGELTSKTLIQDLNHIFANDSLVSNVQLEDEQIDDLYTITDNNEVEIYSKQGKKMLEIIPTDELDSLATIKCIQIFDSKFKTDKGISLASTFRDISENYIINKVETSLTSATLFIDELNATIAIDKKELGINSFSLEEISIDQIPDIAKIKYFTIWFN